jgi:hypothetical protein
MDYGLYFIVYCKTLIFFNTCYNNPGPENNYPFLNRAVGPRMVTLNQSTITYRDEFLFLDFRSWVVALPDQIQIHWRYM